MEQQSRTTAGQQLDAKLDEMFGDNLPTGVTVRAVIRDEPFLNLHEVLIVADGLSFAAIKSMIDPDRKMGAAQALASLSLKFTRLAADMNNGLTGGVYRAPF